MERVLLFIWLSKIKGIGPVLASALLNYFGDIINVYNSDIDNLLKVDGIGEKTAKLIIENKSLDDSRNILEKCNKRNIEIVTRESNNYPIQLKEITKAPLILYVRGNLKSFEGAVAIVGSRRCNDYGKTVIVELAEVLSLKNIPIISGMAKGIDSYAHTVALYNNNYTIAVLGTGVDKCYPSEHITLMNKIIETGAVISQFAPGTSNVKANFIKRNELIAMLSEKIVVVQASKDSGALHTAKYGFEYNKEVYAVPGTIYDKYSYGSNMLISKGAKIYTSPQNIASEINFTTNKEEPKIHNEIEGKILEIVSKRPMSLDEIKIILALNNNKIEEVLFNMEMNRKIKQVGGMFSRQG